jgi:hypothetical protein
LQPDKRKELFAGYSEKLLGPNTQAPTCGPAEAV